MYFLDYLKDSLRLEAKNCMHRILMAGKYHNVGYFKYWLWEPFHNAYHARPFCIANGISSAESLKMIQKAYGESTLSKTENLHSSLRVIAAELSVFLE